MKMVWLGIMVAFLVVPLFQVPASGADLNKIADGLKEALEVGVKNAVEQTSKNDGFYKNIDIKIPLPDQLDQAAEYLEKIKMEKYAEELVKKMNRAAEAAAPKALNIFVDSIKKIQFDDAQKILNGKTDEATLFLKSNTSESLKKEFYPMIKETMEQVNAIKTYNEFVSKYTSNPLLQKVNLDINQYVTDMAIDGLFKIVATEEKKIRENPSARVSDLLKDIFGNLL